MPHAECFGACAALNAGEPVAEDVAVGGGDGVRETLAEQKFVEHLAVFEIEISEGDVVAILPKVIVERDADSSAHYGVFQPCGGRLGLVGIDFDSH